MSCKHKRYGNINSHYAKTRGRCHLCKEPLPPAELFGQIGLLGGEAPTMDHLFPQSWGVDDSPDNLRPAHMRCNSARGVTDPEEARARLSGSASELLTEGEAFSVSAAAAVGAATVLGSMFSRPSPKTGKKEFNPVAGFLGGLAAFLLVRGGID